MALGSGIVILCFSFIALMNKTHDEVCRFGKRVRIGTRLVCVLGLFLLAGLGVDLDPISLMGSIVAILLPLVIFEEYALLRTLKFKETA